MTNWETLAGLNCGFVLNFCWQHTLGAQPNVLIAQLTRQLSPSAGFKNAQRIDSCHQSASLCRKIFTSRQLVSVLGQRIKGLLTQILPHRYVVRSLNKHPKALCSSFVPLNIGSMQRLCVLMALIAA